MQFDILTLEQDFTYGARIRLASCHDCPSHTLREMNPRLSSTVVRPSDPQSRTPSLFPGGDVSNIFSFFFLFFFLLEVDDFFISFLFISLLKQL